MVFKQIVFLISIIDNYDKQTWIHTARYRHSRLTLHILISQNILKKTNPGDVGWCD